MSNQLIYRHKLQRCVYGAEIKGLFYGEFDPGSERTLAAWIRHASRTLIFGWEWRKGEEHVNNLPPSLE